MKDFIIFGIGKVGQRLGRDFNELQIPYQYYVDNNEKMWGEFVNGKCVSSPLELIGRNDITIIIAINESADVEAQLAEMGLIEYCMSYRETEIMMCGYIIEKMRISDEQMIKHQKQVTTYMDHLFTNLLGGMEKWAHVVSKELIEENETVVVVTSEGQKKFLDDLMEYQYVETAYDKMEWSISVTNLIDLMLQSLPCVVICNTISNLYYAAYCVKKLYPDSIKIVVVQHNSVKSYYNKVCEQIEYIDYIMGVSKDICKTLHRDYGISSDKLVYKESFVKIEEQLVREYTTDKKPLKVCFVSRIQIMYKRCDLLIPILQSLEEKGCNYEFYIAGQGAFLEELELFVTENKLDKKVFFLGFLHEEEVNSLLCEQDVFLQCSECEGSSLAMLEAMAYGVVPVVTRVGSAEEFIDNGKNGYICEVNDVEGLAKAIIMLEQNREVLPIFGKISRERVSKQCNLKDYSNYMKRVIKEKDLEQYRSWIKE